MHLDVAHLALAVEADRHRLVGAEHDHRADVVEVRRRPAGDGDDLVARLQPRLGRGGVGQDGANDVGPRRTQGHEEGGEDDDRQQEVGRRAGKHDQEPLPHRAHLERAVAKLRRDVGEIAGVLKTALGGSD